MPHPPADNPFAPTDNPLRDDRPDTWDRLIEAVHPASLLILIDGQLGPRLRI